MKPHRPHGLARALATGLAALLVLVACQSTPTQPTPTPTTGTISGSLSVVASGSAASGSAVGGTSEATASTPVTGERGAPLTPLPSPAAPSAELGELVPGEVIVRFADGVRASSFATLDAGGVRLQSVRPLALPNATLYRAVGADRAATLALIAALRSRPDVLYAEPNLVLRPLRTPDDPRYGNQWHYPAIGLPAAWDVTTGSADVVVAVGDTGILYAGDASPATHPDLVGRVLPGYDFISNEAFAADGDGRDPDPYDVGDDPSGQSSYHGTHVAGTIGAASDNATGVAGVDWAARILPVRMLGVGGGTLVDIIEGTLWAAGFSVAAVPDNPTPAHVINLSLGGTSPCPTLAQEAFDRIAAEAPNAAIVVVAAGNEGADAGFTTPANCGNVVVVGATDYAGERAFYSNYGPRVDVMAPGGDPGANLSGNGNDGVLSLTRDDAAGAFAYGFQVGTSMAAPHVAGVISLMKSLAPGLSRTEALAALTATARPLTPEACGRPSGGDCGAGLIDAAAAVAAVAGGDVPTPGGGAIVYEPNPVDYGATLVTRDIRLTNTGTATVDWFIVGYRPDPANPGAVPAGALTVDAASGVLAPDASTTIATSLDRSFVTAPGTYRIDLVFSVDGVDQPLTVRFRTAEAATTPTGPTRILAVDDTDVDTISAARSYPAFVTSYAVSTAPGRYVVIAWSDENRDGVLNEGDYFGLHPNPVDVVAGHTVTGIDIAVAPVLSAGDSEDTRHEFLSSRASARELAPGDPHAGDGPSAP